MKGRQDASWEKDRYSSQRALVLKPDHAGISRVVAALCRGELCALPTDTLYGVVGALAQAGVANRIFAAKNRGRDVVLPVLCADFAQAAEIAVLQGEAAELAHRFWPGPLTLVCARRAGFTADLGAETGTVGVRVPDHPVPRAVARRVGPLASSSANLHGEEPPDSPEEIAALFQDSLTFVVGVVDVVDSVSLAGEKELPKTQGKVEKPLEVPGRAAGSGTGRGSTVVRCTAEGTLVEVLRVGDISPAVLGFS